MRKYINLIESIADEFHLNVEIENILSDEEPKIRPILRDSLELIKNSNGIRIDDWDYQMTLLYPTISKPELQEIFKLSMEKFNFLIWFDDINDMAHWQVKSRAPDGDIELNSPIAQAAKSQIEIVGRAQQFMKAAGEFTKEQLVDHLSQSLPRSTADMFADHILMTLHGMMDYQRGLYKWRADKKAPTASEVINNLKNM